MEKAIKKIAFIGAMLASVYFFVQIVYVFFLNDYCNLQNPPWWTGKIIEKLCDSKSQNECDVVGGDWHCNCISSNFWTPFPADYYSYPSDGCWDLSFWGLTAREGDLLILAWDEGKLLDPSTYYERGIVTPVKGNIRISFDLNIDLIHTKFKDYPSYLSFGVVPSNPSNLTTTGSILMYMVESPDSPVFIKVYERGAIQEDMSQEYTRRETQEVTIETTSVEVFTYVDGDLLIGSSPLPEEPIFLIGYVIPRGGEITATISNFSIEEADLLVGR